MEYVLAGLLGFLGGMLGGLVGVGGHAAILAHPHGARATGGGARGSAMMTA